MGLETLNSSGQKSEILFKVRSTRARLNDLRSRKKRYPKKSKQILNAAMT